MNSHNKIYSRYTPSCIDNDHLLNDTNGGITATIIKDMPSVLKDWNKIMIRTSDLIENYDVSVNQWSKKMTSMDHIQFAISNLIWRLTDDTTDQQDMFIVEEWHRRILLYSDAAHQTDNDLVSAEYFQMMDDLGFDPRLNPRDRIVQMRNLAIWTGVRNRSVEPPVGATSDNPMGTIAETPSAGQGAVNDTITVGQASPAEYAQDGIVNETAYEFEYPDVLTSDPYHVVKSYVDAIQCRDDSDVNIYALYYINKYIESTYTYGPSSNNTIFMLNAKK